MKKLIYTGLFLLISVLAINAASPEINLNEITDVDEVSNPAVSEEIIIDSVVSPFQDGLKDFDKEIEEEVSTADSLAFDFPDALREFQSVMEQDRILRLAIVLSDIYSKKDMEFTRGFLLGMKDANLSPNSVSLKVINGEIPQDSLLYELEAFEPQVIVSTFEKNAPVVISSYAFGNKSKLINAFDAKGDSYLYNENVYQLLSPSEDFNAAISKYAIENFPGNILVLIGEPDYSDLMIRDLILEWPEDDILILSIPELAGFTLEDGQNYLFCPVSSNAKDIKDSITQIVRLIADTPSAGVKILGRPNMIAMNDLNSVISNLDVYLPVKCYFDPTSDKGKKFISRYHSSYGHAPIRSYPVFAGMGYDTALYFLPYFTNSDNGNDPQFEPENLIQSYFNMRKSGWAGYYNQGSIMLHFEPWGTLTKELLN